MLDTWQDKTIMNPCVLGKFNLVHTYLPICILIKLNIYILDAVGSWQKILPMPNLERAY